MKTDNLEKQKFTSIFHMLVILFYCFCGGEFRVRLKFPQCYPDNTYTIIQWQCKLCQKTVTSDHIEKENDYEGLK